MKNRAITIPKLEWLDPLKAFALLGVLFNHLVEEFHKGPLFTGFEDFSLIRLMAWVGDFGPGVFIICSGIGLTWATLHRNDDDFSFGNFYKRRLLRIFPLYIGLHLILLALAVIAPESILQKHHAYPLTLAHPKMLLSILGLRFTDSLFSFISPSWWFVWLVIQLYLVFPILYLLMRRIGVQQFLILTLILTLACRAFGILFPTAIPWQIDKWLLGIFFGTRLVEFCAGMAIAFYLKQSNARQFRLPSSPTIFFVCLLLLTLGLTFQNFNLGKIVSFPIISLALTGIFYFFWQSGFRKIPVLSCTITWIGIQSYAIFLIHQPPLQYAKLFARHSDQLHLLIAISVLLLSFPAGWIISKIVTKLQTTAVVFKDKQTLRIFSIIVCVCMGIVLIFINMPTVWGWKHRAFSLVLGLAIIFLGYTAYVRRTKDTWVEHILRGAILLACLLKISVFHSRYGSFSALGIGFLAAISTELLHRRMNSRWRAWSVVLVGLILVVSIGEMAIRVTGPFGYGRWGELPALQVHPTRTYSLQPNMVKRLRYYSYDYIIRTNSLGLASPEIDIDKPTPDTLRILVIGDAFSMPEGMEYKDAYPALLEESITNSLAPRNVQIINAGVTGYGPMEQTPQLKELGPLVKPDIVIYQYFINEIGSVNQDQEKLLVEIGLIPCYISGYCNYANRSELLHQIGKIGGYALKGVTGDRRQSRHNFQKAHLRYYQKKQHPIYSQANLNALRSRLQEMNTICHELGAKFIIYFVPGAVAVSKPDDLTYFPRDRDLSNQTLYDFSKPFNVTKDIADDIGIPIVDLTIDLKTNPIQPVYFPSELHWNKEGHRVAARVIAEDLEQRGWLH